MNQTIDTTDHMPPEVATDLLTNPKGKMTAGFRRACMGARETVRVSGAPILRVRNSDPTEYRHLELNRRTVEQKLGKRLAALTAERLAQLKRRAHRRAAKCFELAQVTTGVLRSSLIAKYERFVMLRDAAENELAARCALGSDRPENHIHPRHLRK